MSARDPLKQARVEASLKRLSKSSKAYKNISKKIQTGFYRKSKKNKTHNLTFIHEEMEKFKSRIAKKGNKGKIAKLYGLSHIIENNTNVENNISDAPPSLQLESIIPVQSVTTATSAALVGQISNYTKVPQSLHPIVAQKQVQNVEDNLSVLPDVSSKLVVNQVTASEAALSTVPLFKKDDIEEKYKENVQLPVFDTHYEEINDKHIAFNLEQRLQECTSHCEQLRREKKEFDDFIHKKSIEGITLSDKKTLIDLLIERILDTDTQWKSKIDQLINIPTSLKGEGFLRGGDYFEALFQVAIAIGILPQFSNKFVKFYDIHDYKNIVHFPNYLHTKTIKNSGGGEQGISDITFEVSTNPQFDSTKIQKSYECGEVPQKRIESKNPFYFISVKGYKKEKTIKSEYDIPLLDQQLHQFPSDLNKHIIVCVRNKNKFIENLSRTKIDFLKSSINCVIGYDEIIDAFTAFRLNFFNRLEENPTLKMIAYEIHILFPPDNVYKPSLNLYFHQELIVKSIITRIQEVNIPTRPHFLCIGVLPRGGKSFIAGGIINSHKKLKDKESGYNVLFLTSAITETRDQFRNDLIDKFSDFSDFQFIDVVNDTTITKTNGFYFVSRQLISMSEDKKDDDDKVERIAADMIKILETRLKPMPEFDIIFFDEAHVGITSNTVRSNFQKAFARFKIPIVLMTATYKKPAKLLDSNKDLFVWDLQDIKDMQSLPVLTFDGFKEKGPDIMERYPEIAVDLLQRRINHGEQLEAISRPYINFPTPNFISLAFSPDTITHLKRTGSGYEFTKAFEANVVVKDLLDHKKYKDWGKMIRHREDAMRLRQFLTPEQEMDELEFLQNKDRKYRALNQIFTIAQRNKSRPIQGKPFSILMFLPFGFKDSPGIGELCRIWASFMLESTYWRDNFVFLTLSRYNHKDLKMDPDVSSIESAVKLAVEHGRICHRDDFDKTKDLKQIIIDVEREALRYGKGLVLLSGDVAKMGISLKCVDVVFLLSNNEEADDIIQKMYRALTDDPPDKKDGFIVDLNLTRSIKAMFDYDMEKDKMRSINPVLPSVGERLQKVWDLCNWGQDSFIEDHPEMDFNAIMIEIKRRVLDDLERKILDEFDKDYKKLEEEQLRLIEDDEELYRLIQNILQNTKSDNKSTKKQKQKTVIIREAPQIPSAAGPAASEPVAPNLSAPVAPVAPVASVLTIQEIKKRIMSILQTFINALVIKSAESWDYNLNLVSLLSKYNKDKLLLKDTVVSCDCKINTNCLDVHDNLYEAAFCEIRNYAILSHNNIYSIDTHNMIMIIIENAFKNPSSLIMWNTYIENLLKDIKAAKKIPMNAII